MLLLYAFAVLLSTAHALDPHCSGFQPCGTGNSPCPTSPPSPSSSAQANGDQCGKYWLELMNHQGKAAFNTDQAYKVFRNVKEYGAKGDGHTDDTAAINKAISDGNRCEPLKCQSSTTTLAVVYFPSGKYLISSPLIDYYYTQIIGDPNCRPILIASPKFTPTGSANGLITGSLYGELGEQGFLSVNTFFRQVRNLILDMTQVPVNVEISGIHWPVGQATSLQNLEFRMSNAPETRHQGLFIENGSGGFMVDLVFNGGDIGMYVGSQQFTSRNLSFHNCNKAIYQSWNWGWTYKNMLIDNCKVGFNISDSANATIMVGSLTLIDSSIKNTETGIVNMRAPDSYPDSAGSLYLENVELHNVGVAVKNLTTTIMEGTLETKLIDAWADGHWYLDTQRQQNLPVGPAEGRAYIPPTRRPSALLDSNRKYYERSKPQYETVSKEDFLSARDLGVMGDGKTDDAVALNAAILQAADEGKILFVDAGTYLVSSTIYIPPGSRIVGEALASVILSSGDIFNSINVPQAVVMVGLPGEQGWVEWSDMIVSTRGQQTGAVLIKWNLASDPDNYISGMWDVHARIGGFTGTELQTTQCPTTPTKQKVNPNCIGAYMAMHVTKYASGLYMENVWLWIADHDLDDAANNSTQITVYTGRGLLVESEEGAIWLYGTAVEHAAKYQYQFVDTQQIVMGYIQTETAYYQPNPMATLPFTNATFNDPQFLDQAGSSDASRDGWGLRIVRSTDIVGYGAGLYSFFNNYSQTCLQLNATSKCQPRIFSIEKCDEDCEISIYNLNTVGVDFMVTRDGEDLARRGDNTNTFADTINAFRTN